MLFTKPLQAVRLLTRVNVIDNSAIGKEVKEAGKKVKVIAVYNKTRHPTGGLGDKILVTILGQMKKGYLTGDSAPQRSFVPRLDTNNVVLVDNNDVPLGTRILGPVPNILRKQGAKTARLMAIGTKFV